MQAYGFMMYADAVYGVKLTLEQAEAMRDAYFELYPALPHWHQRQIMEAQQTGMVRSPLGRLRHLPNIFSPIKSVQKKSQNQAINSPIQGTLVDMMWWSMGIIEEQRPELLTPCAQVHDQGIWYAPEGRVDEAVAYSGEIMENLPFEDRFGWKPELKFTSDAEVGLNLADLKEVA
jgi:DNA polymerase I-like protein with 3'-5' exonuclease and polymerase domains